MSILNKEKKHWLQIFVKPVLYREFFGHIYLYKVGTSVEPKDSHHGREPLIEQYKYTNIILSTTLYVVL